jgi:di/tricarboxylate transporter
VGEKMNLKHLLPAFTLIFATLFLFVHPRGFTQLEANVFSILSISLMIWITGILPAYMGSLFLFVAGVLVGIPAKVVFSGFYSDAFWLIFSGMIIGVAVKNSGMSTYLSRITVALFGSSYQKMIVGIVVFAMILGFLMPSSMGRAVLLVPICIALAHEYGFKRGDKGFSGMLLAGAFGSSLPALAVLPANIPNVVLAGSAQTLFGIKMYYASYLLLHFPVLGLLKGIVIILSVILIFPDTPKVIKEHKKEKIKTSRILFVSLLLGITLLMWFTDSIHGIAPAWVGLTSAFILLLPKIGTISQKELEENVLHGPLLFVAGIMGFGALLASSGLGTKIANMLLAHLTPVHGNDPYNFFLLSAFSSVAGLITTLPGVPALMTPLAPKLASASGWSLQAVLMTQVVGFSTALFPYQSPPLVVSAELSKIKYNELLKLSLFVAVVTIVFLVPLDYEWWRLLGYIH